MTSSNSGRHDTSPRSFEAVELLQRYFDEHRERLLEDFFTYLRFESISTEPEYAPRARACAEWVRGYLEAAGLEAELWETKRHPIVFAQWQKAGPDKPTVLLYGHYDVQPVTPLELWSSPPFEPTIRDGEIFARGAQDNKGQSFYTMAAIAAMLQQYGSLPVNVKLCIEGEEEAGSSSLADACRERADAFRADYFYVVDMGFHRMEEPAITLGLRGILTMTLELTASRTDLHSGTHGGVAYNANHALLAMLAKLRDERGRITVPGFYDDVMTFSESDRRSLAFDFDEAQYQAMFGGLPNGGEVEYEPLERAWLRPTLEINGIAGGYFGEGFKTVIPAKAVAKLSCRLVANQDANDIQAKIASYLRSLLPEGIELKISHEHSGRSLYTTSESRAVTAAALAYTQVCGIPCRFIMCGGSVPIAAALAETSGAETGLIGYGLAGDNIHAPNEHFGVERLKKGMATIGSILVQLGEK